MSRRSKHDRGVGTCSKTLSASIVVVALCAVTVSAQTQTPQPSQTITVSGCAQRETDVLKRNPMAGNVGMADEFVLTRAELTPGGQAPATEQPEQPTPPAPRGTSGGASDIGKVYRVTGDKESELKKYIGQRVEILGTFKHEDARRELGTIGTSGKPPATAG
jgi:hypothetical protein